MLSGELDRDGRTVLAYRSHTVTGVTVKGLGKGGFIAPDPCMSRTRVRGCGNFV